MPDAFWISAVEVPAYPRLANSASATSRSRSRLEPSAWFTAGTVHVNCAATRK